MLTRTPPTEILQPKCAELPGQYLGEHHAECWVEITDWPGCFLWRTHFHSDQITNWSGECREGTADGHGVYSVSAGSEHTAYEGMDTMVGGKANRHWVEEWTGGGRYEGEWRNDKARGDGVRTTSAGFDFRGMWTHGCFGTRDHWAVVGSTPEACGFE